MLQLWKMFVLCVLSWLGPALVLAEEPGYREALEYFKAREGKRLSLDFSKEQQETVVPPKASASLFQFFKHSKWFLQPAFETDSDTDRGGPVVQFGKSFLKNKWVQQSLGIEWRDFHRGPHSLSVFYRVQGSGQLFFVAPFFSLGGGREFKANNLGGFASVKVGVKVQNHWSASWLGALGVYYRRDQTVGDAQGRDLFGFSLALGF